MSFLDLFKAYLSLNALLGFTALSLLLMRLLDRHARYRSQLRATYLLIAASLVLPLLAPMIAPNDFWQPSSQIWTAASMRGAESQDFAALTPVVSLTASGKQLAIADGLYWLGLSLGLGMLGISFSALRSLLKLRKILSASFTLHRYHSVTVRLSEQITIPFSFWWPFRAYAVLPSSLLEHPENFHLALAHELQHHRQHDTKWLHAITLMKILCFWNPAIYALDRWLSDLQEFACDEALVGHRRISPSAYGRCLIWVAETSLLSHRPLVGTASMAHGTAKKTLHRRIEFMLRFPNKKVRKGLLTSLTAASLLAMGGMALATNASIQDRRITMAQAQHLLESVPQDTGVPVNLNAQVLAELNRYLGTPDGRHFIADSLQRMESYKPALQEALARYGAPEELLAIPIVESGYQNISAAAYPSRYGYGAGIWMFITETAREFGLRVQPPLIDERNDVELETDAAMRYLGSMKLRFRDWRLAILAYNGGAKLVNDGITATGSTDVWDLIHDGYENDPNYVAKVMAAILILKNPALLD